MKITIDTKQDSRDEIRKVVKLLHELMDMKHQDNRNQNYNSSGYDTYGNTNYNAYDPYNQTSQNSQPAQQEAPAVEPGFFNMFDSTPSVEQAVVKTQEPEKKKEADQFEIYEY